MTTKTKKPAAPKDWKCNECGKLMTFKAAEKAIYGMGCSKCGGADIDLAPTAFEKARATVAAKAAADPALAAAVEEAAPGFLGKLGL